MAKEARYRKFLNRASHHSVAAVQVRVENDRRHPTGELVISDCRRSIILDLDVWDSNDYTNTMFKLSVLSDAIEFAKKAVTAAYANKEGTE